MPEQETERKIQKAFRGHYAYVLGSLLTLLAIYPFVEQGGWLNWVLDGAFLLVILFCFLVSLGRRYWRLMLVLAFASEALAAIGRLAGVETLDSPMHILRVLMVFAAMVVVLRDVMRARRVTMDTVLAAASVYLLLALVWSSVYVALESWHPGSFALRPTDGPNSMSTNPQLMYFSLITLTTVGYGDITPVSPQASYLAALEGLVGQLFIAIILARLVAMELMARSDKRDEEEL